MSLTLVKVGVAGLLGVGVLCPICESPSEAQPFSAATRAVAFGAVQVAGPSGALPAAPDRVRAPASDTTRVKLAIEGMTCGSCATTAKIVLRRVPGVLQADVSYEESSAEVAYDAEVTEPAEFIARLEKMTGYKARVTDGGNQQVEARTGTTAPVRPATDENSGS